MIETERLIIRPFTEEDFETLCRLRADEEVMRYMGGAEFTKPEKIRERFDYYLEHQKKHGFAVSGVILKETNEMIALSLLIQPDQLSSLDT